MAVSRMSLRLLPCASCAWGLLAAEQSAVGGDLLCEADGGCRPDASLGLLQLSMQQQVPQPTASNWSYPRLLQAEGHRTARQKDDCEKYPVLCGEPFNCFSDPFGPADLLRSAVGTIATEDGHANLKSWCLMPGQGWDQTVAKYCIATPDLVKSAHLVFDKQVKDGAGELDGSYCFIEGHCVNTEVTPETTLAEAETLCDKKYGHDAWAKLNYLKAPSPFLLSPLSKFNGFPSKEWPSFFGKLACAMGNFHCDVIYCRETYCKMPHYRSKYEHFLKDYGWE